MILHIFADYESCLFDFNWFNKLEQTVTRILIADDHYLISKLIKMMLATSRNSYVVNLVKTGNEAIDYIKKNEVDLVLLDIDMPDLDGISVLKFIKENFNSIKVIMISNHTEPWLIKRALRLGANGYVSKYADSEEILNAINKINQNEVFLCQNTLRIMYSVTDNQNESSEVENFETALSQLTKRELEITKYIVDEYSTKEISDKLFISTRTVETHRKNIMAKLGVKNTIGLIKLTLENNLYEQLNPE